ncbi:MAG: hypothetical protein Q9Q40_11455 [Acidobacteriota bacterium]|nr:hypothetical protein [Acidobacteriota bacterium]MDQ7086373.1 hypothetical protein [Acidobacteriota bacterium]
MTAVLVILTIVLFIAIDLVRLRYERRRRADQAQPVAAFSPLRYPRGIFLSSGHSWASLTDVGEIRVGADELVTQALGRVDRVELPEAGTHVERGRPLAHLQEKGRTLAICSPVTGVVVAVNPAAPESLPDALKDDPYGAGWFARIWPAEHTEALAGLKVGERAAAWLRSEVQRLADFLSRRSAPRGEAPVLADGAQPALGAIGLLDDAGLEAFGEEFLHMR